ncbi:MAG: T9SS type A sorting domain-containing protein, partial [Bacteroidota bacterium]
IAPHAARPSGKVMTTAASAGDCIFRDVTFLAPNGPSTFNSDTNFPLCFLDDIAQDMLFLDCTFIGGSVGVYWNALVSGTNPIVRVLGSDFFEQSRKFAALRYFHASSQFHFLDNQLSTTIPNDFTGVHSEAANATIWIRDNDFTFQNSHDLLGVDVEGRNLDIKRNSFYAIDCEEVTGVRIEALAENVEVKNNHIVQYLPTISVTSTSPFTGIAFEATSQTGGYLTQVIDLSNNFISSQHGWEGTGIRAKLKGHTVAQKLYVNNNEIHFTRVGEGSQGLFRGIEVDGGNAEVGPTQFNRNGIRMMYMPEGIAEVAASGILVAALVHNDDFSLFNNDIEIEYETEDDERGISLTAIAKKAGANATPVWIGNNMVSLNSRRTTSYGLVMEDVDSSMIYHNSFHIYDTDFSSGIWEPAGINIFSPSGAIQELEAQNNIVLMDADGLLIDWDCACPLLLNKNLYYTPTHRPNRRWRLNGAIHTGIAAWRTATGQEAFSIGGNPHFYAPPGNPYNDLHIESTSNALNQALVMPFPPEAAILNQDIDGDSRIGSGNPDIGADERPMSNKNAAPFANENRATTWEMFPNPAGETLYLRHLRPGTLRILDAQGRELLHLEVMETDAQISLADLPAGMYVVTFTPEGKSPEFKKLIRR